MHKLPLSSSFLLKEWADWFGECVEVGREGEGGGLGQERKQEDGFLDTKVRAEK